MATVPRKDTLVGLNACEFFPRIKAHGQGAGRIRIPQPSRRGPAVLSRADFFPVLEFAEIKRTLGFSKVRSRAGSHAARTANFAPRPRFSRL